MTFNLHFTDFCNYKCKYCFIKKDYNELSMDGIKTIIDKIYDFSIKNKEEVRINLAGGEPLVSNNIQTIIDYIYQKGLKVSIITNGYYLTDSFIANNKDKIGMIGISVDSLDDKTNINIGRCCGKRVLAKERLLHIKEIIKSTQIKLKINICCSKANLSEDMTDILYQLKADRVKLLRVMCDHDDSLRDYELTDDEWNIIKKRYEGIPNTVFEDINDMKTRYIIIDSKGNVSRNNLHISNNSLLDKSIEDCLEAIKVKVAV